jgi:hypothetical protein
VSAVRYQLADQHVGHLVAAFGEIVADGTQATRACSSLARLIARCSEAMGTSLGSAPIVKANGFVIEYGPVTEPWGVTRFCARDPFGRLVNILEHR